jgi:inosine-uridine nucleoside N-ribohydrolase
VYAAPFFNDRSKSPGDGMEKSYEEILRVLDKMEVNTKEGFVFKGATRYLGDIDTPCDSDAVQDIIKRAETSKNTLYVIAIGAATNVASAILISPEIIKKIAVIWLGGHAHYWPHTKEFNLAQDVIAARVLFDCGVPLVQIPCFPVASHLITTVTELERYLECKSEIGRYLTDIVRNYSDNHFAWSKVIWDIAAVAYLVNSSWVTTQVVHSPILTDQITWSIDKNRHFIKTAVSVDRDKIFADLFNKA